MSPFHPAFQTFGDPLSAHGVGMKKVSDPIPGFWIWIFAFAKRLSLEKTNFFTQFLFVAWSGIRQTPSEGCLGLQECARGNEFESPLQAKKVAGSGYGRKGGVPLSFGGSESNSGFGGIKNYSVIATQCKFQSLVKARARDCRDDGARNIQKHLATSL